jgi:hypothetical protein
MTDLARHTLLLTQEDVTFTDQVHEPNFIMQHLCELLMLLSSLVYSDGCKLSGHLQITTVKSAAEIKTVCVYALRVVELTLTK